MSEYTSVQDYLSKKNKAKVVTPKPIKQKKKVRMTNVVTQSTRKKVDKQFKKVKQLTALQRQTLNIAKKHKLSGAETILNKFL